MDVTKYLENQSDFNESDEYIEGNILIGDDRGSEDSEGMGFRVSNRLTSQKPSRQGSFGEGKGKVQARKSLRHTLTPGGERPTLFVTLPMAHTEILTQEKAFELTIENIQQEPMAQAEPQPTPEISPMQMPGTLTQETVFDLSIEPLQQTPPDIDIGEQTFTRQDTPRSLPENSTLKFPQMELGQLSKASVSYSTMPLNLSAEDLDRKFLEVAYIYTSSDLATLTANEKVLILTYETVQTQLQTNIDTLETDIAASG